MAKSNQKPRQKQTSSVKIKNHRRNEDLPDDMYDEVDAFHKQKDMIRLDGKDEEKNEEGSEEDFGVYDMANESEEEDDEDSEESEDDERLRALEEEEKRFRKKRQLEEGEDSDEESEPDDNIPAGQWGRKKSAYYEDGENEEEEALLEEEAEAERLQKLAAQNLSNQDFGLPSSEEEEEEEEEEDDDEEDSDILEKQVEREDIRPKDMKKDTPEFLEDKLELEALLNTFKSALQEVRSRIGPLLKEVKEGQLATAEGLSYLETKNLLLLQYIMHLTFYFLLRAEGKSVKSHPVISRLVEIRTYLEKIRPIDKKLEYQINKLLTSQQLVKANTETAEEAEMDPLNFRPNPEALVPKITANEGANGDLGGVYKPPMLNPISMEDDPDKDYNKKKRRAAEEKARTSGRSQIVSDFAREIQGAPDEIREARVEGDDAYAARQRERLLRRAEEEEELMMRVPLAKKELKGLRAVQKKGGFSGGAMLDDFADDVADLVQASSQIEGHGRLSQKFGADLSQQLASLGKQSGDAELSNRASLADRRAKTDNAKALKTRKAMDFDGDDDEALEVPKSKKTKRSQENVLYNDVVKQTERKKAEKQAKYKARPTAVPLEDETEEGPRKLSKVVEQNRGLTPHRRKDAKNPRVKGRKKFEKANIRRRGQVQTPRSQAGPYGGETTGIKSGLSKSTRF